MVLQRRLSTKWCVMRWEIMSANTSRESGCFVSFNLCEVIDKLWSDHRTVFFLWLKAVGCVLWCRLLELVMHFQTALKIFFVKRYENDGFWNMEHQKRTGMSWPRRWRVLEWKLSHPSKLRLFAHFWWNSGSGLAGWKRTKQDHKHAKLDLITRSLIIYRHFLSFLSTTKITSFKLEQYLFHKTVALHVLLVPTSKMIKNLHTSKTLSLYTNFRYQPCRTKKGKDAGPSKRIRPTRIHPRNLLKSCHPWNPNETYSQCHHLQSQR